MIEFSNVKTLQKKILLTCYTVASLLLFLYSYTQVDLNLTLSQVSVWQDIQKIFQYIGYYKRPLSTGIYVSLIGIFYALYAVVIHMCHKRRMERVTLWRIIFLISAFLVLSYPAFSYDMFNYMFTAKTVLIYHKNPYTVTPQQFIGFDSWIYFMRWIHLPSAYTPVWIFLTLPFYLLGFGYFLLIMWNIKILVAASYLVVVWCIEQILNLADRKHSLIGVAIYALNPLIIIESLVNAHNDSVMMMLAMFAILLYMLKRPLASWLLLSLSIGLKLMTTFLLPLYFFHFNRKYLLVAMVIGLILVLFQREVLPWYMLWIMPFVALLPEKTDVTILAGAYSLGLLLRYVPYLYLGHWNDPAPYIKEVATISSVIIAVLIVGIRVAVQRSRSER